MEQAELLRLYIDKLPDFELREESTERHDHMGALLVEAVLQAGIRYETVVAPRVAHILAAYPEASTTSAFARLLMLEGAPALLHWTMDRKMLTLVEVTQYFLVENVETVTDLRAWLLQPHNRSRLLAIKGIGPKTADYFKDLCGLSTSLIDVYLYRFLAQAGVDVKGYDAAQAVIRDTASLLAVNERVLDYSIWSYMAERGRGTGDST